MAVDWLRIKTEYINGDISYRDLAKKWSVPFPTLRDRAARESWKEAKEQQRNKVVTETSQKTVNKISDNESEIASIKSRIRLKIYQELESRLNAEDVEGADFRRLVQSYKDMCDIVVDDGDDGEDGVRVVIDV